MARKHAPKFNTQKAQEFGGESHETPKFFAVTVPARGFQKLVRFVQNGFVWTHKDFVV